MSKHNNERLYNMKLFKGILLLLSMLTFSPELIAQQNSQSGIVNQLELSEDQASSVQQELQLHADKLKEIKEADLKRKARRKANEEEQKRHEAALKQLMGEEQFSQYQNLKESFSSKNRRGKGRGMNSEKMMQRLKQELELSSEQEQKMKALLEVQMGHMQDLRASGTSPEDMREEMMLLREENNKKMAEILTDDQMTKYREMMNNRGGRRM